MSQNVAILELKYGNIYGGMPNFFAIAEITLLVYEKRSNKIFMESFINTADIDYVSVYSKTDELGHTIGRGKEVINMRNGRSRPFMEEFQLDERALQYTMKNLRPLQRTVKNFLTKNFHKYRIDELITFDGRRDIFLCERCGVDFYHVNIIDLQKEINKETDYLFSLNKLSVITNFQMDGVYLRSNNEEYWLHPIAAKQLYPKSAAWDAARLLMVHNEYRMHHPDFMVRAQKLLMQIQAEKKDEPKADKKDEKKE